ncbi:MAG: cell division protein ZipA C-terminal FtsZ-binding domain-containing protein [SAR86 cluster bacterium]|nr:cell division protein ZipA C-terminal FtsZ-binding domain-containing protein [SAR86 cluster bacterium]
MNLSEILTIFIGLFLGLVIVDITRRANRRRRNNLKFASSFIEIDQELKQNEIEESSNLSKSIEEEEIETEIANQERSEEGILLILYLKSQGQNELTLSLFKAELETVGMTYHEKGYFFFNSMTASDIHFSLLNGMKPGVLDEQSSTQLLSLVLDTRKNLNPVESFERMMGFATWFSESFKTDLLDDSRNILTKQMIDHMRQKAQEEQRQNLSAVNNET